MKQFRDQVKSSENDCYKLFDDQGKGSLSKKCGKVILECSMHINESLICCQLVAFILCLGCARHCLSTYYIFHR